MDRQLEPAEIAELNQVHAHSEKLINVRGQSNGFGGVYRRAPWQVTFERTSNTDCSLDIHHAGACVLHTDWSAEQPAGRTTYRPGDWRGEFLQLPAAHA